MDYSEEAKKCFCIAEKCKDKNIKAFYENAGTGYLYKLCRLQGMDPVVAKNKPFRKDGVYFGITAGIADPEEYFGVRDITVYEYDQNGNILAFDYWDAEGNRCHKLLDN